MLYLRDQLRCNVTADIKSVLIRADSEGVNKLSHPPGDQPRGNFGIENKSKRNTIPPFVARHAE
jgi:hypothetical protein